MRSGPGLDWRGPALSYAAPPGTGSRPVYTASPGGSATPPGAGGRPVYAPSGGASTPPGRPLYAAPGGSATPPGSVGRPLYGPQGGGLTVRMPPLPGHQPQVIKQNIFILFIFNNCLLGLDAILFCLSFTYKFF